jgi:hypothetical protein
MERSRPIVDFDACAGTDVGRFGTAAKARNHKYYKY